MKKLLILTFLTLVLLGNAQPIYRTKILNSNVKTLQVGVEGNSMILPTIELGTAESIKVSFDELSHDAHSYSYTVLHCNANWTASDMSTNEYLSGFTTGNVIDARLSENTTIQYTQYTINFPNDNMQFKLSGNYVVLVYEDTQKDKPVAQACFSVIDPQVKITATVRGNTDTELNGRLQQLDFEVYLNGYSIKNPTSEIKVVVRQNNRYDNELLDLKPSFVTDTKLSYINTPALIFEGGYEYHRFDISSIYAAGPGLDEIKFFKPTYNAFLTPDKIRTTRIYQSEQDVNGKFVINLQDAFADDDVEADYMLVHFYLKPDQPFFDGNVYIGGEFNHNLLTDAVKMRYDANTEMYTQSILLKQGGYNYQYWFVPKGDTKATASKVEGSYWQTNNEYTIYVYHRPWGARYDKLIGVSSMNSFF